MKPMIINTVKEPLHERAFYFVGTCLWIPLVLVWCVVAGLLLAWTDARQDEIDREHGEGEA